MSRIKPERVSPTRTSMLSARNIDTTPYTAPTAVVPPRKLWRYWKNHQGTDRTRLKVPQRDLGGKWVIVTGSNSGIGREVALELARWGANLILACRHSFMSEPHPASVVEECVNAARANNRETSTIEWWHVDFTDLATVENFCQKWIDTGLALDVLCNNAGIGSNPGGRKIIKTVDGFEIMHQVNFLSHVLLTMRLLPSLAKAEQPRIVFTSSCFHYFGRFNLDNCNGELERTGIQGVKLYQNNKLWLQIWLTELHRRMMRTNEYRHVTVNGVHPGWVNSGIWNMTQQGWNAWAFSLLTGSISSLLGISNRQGAVALLHVATQEEPGPEPTVQGVGSPAGRGGGRYFNRVIEEIPMPHTKDPDCRNRVWRKVNEELKLEEKGLLKHLGVLYESCTSQQVQTVHP